MHTGNTSKSNCVLWGNVWNGFNNAVSDNKNYYLIGLISAFGGFWDICSIFALLWLNPVYWHLFLSNLVLNCAENIFNYRYY